MVQLNPMIGDLSASRAVALLFIILGFVLTLCGCTLSDPGQSALPVNAKPITVGLISVEYPEDYKVLSSEGTSELISEDGSSCTLRRAIVGTEDYAVTYVIEHAEGMTLDDAKSEVDRSMNLLSDSGELDDGARTLAELTIWEPVREARIDGRNGFVSSNVMYGDIKVITYHVETGSDSIGMVTGAIPLELYNENAMFFDAVFLSMKVL